MTRRRRRGEGTVYQDGNWWVARIDLGIGADGKRRQVKRRTKTESEAYAHLNELRKEAQRLVDQHDHRNRTMVEAVDSFLAVQPATRAEKTIEMENWRASMIVKGIGARKVIKLSVADCDEFLARAVKGTYGKRPLGIEAARRLRRLLINVVRNEQRIGIVDRNVADLSVLPGDLGVRSVDDDEDGDSSTSSHRALDHSEFRELWRIARWPLLVVVDLCGRNGLRPSEARALRWQQVDLDAMELTVNRQMSSTNRPTKPKTKRSVRTNPIDDRTAKTLLAWRSRQDQKRERAGDRWSDNNLIVSTRYGTPIGARNLLRMVNTAGTEAGVGDLAPYELRHTAITFQIDAGRETWDVADWAGTSERMIEEVYRHRLNRVSKIRPVELDGLDDEIGSTEGSADEPEEDD